ncbi:MAG: alpha/beta hydrolase-fold protein [Ferruginibacter sp.]
MKSITTLFITVFFTSIGFAQTSTKPFVLGVIEELPSTILAEKRILNIYLPEGYHKNDSSKYPVIYLLDGSADEDFIHVAGLVQFNNFSWINRVPKSIVVGIANTDRQRDLTFSSTLDANKKMAPTSGRSDAFINFIEKELQPFIEKKYKANTERTIIGQSLGGLLATEILLKKPMLFNKYIIISPSLWWDNGSLLQLSSTLLLESFNQVTGIYIGVGKEGLTPGPNPRVMEVDANVLAEKIRLTKSKTVQVHFDYLPQEDHATIGHQAVFNAFRLLYSDEKNN